ncbi:hypothetical protein [Glutamicibacter protophormiae]|uniref:hypothetical protein n=1 Tax=Glutamicibacter protophormiae TaxID=37930 RepID=UPI003A94BF67
MNYSSLESLVLAHLESGDPLKRTGSNTKIEPSELRKALSVPKNTKVGPKGLVIQGYKFNQELNLDQLTINFPLEFRKCTFAEGVTLKHANINGLSFRNCRFRSDNSSALIAVGSTITNDLHIEASKLKNNSATCSTIDIARCQIYGRLVLNEAKVDNTNGLCIDADRLFVKNSFELTRGLQATGRGDKGLIRLIRARIQSQLVLNGATLTNPTGPVIVADGINIGGAAFFQDNFNARGASPRGLIIMTSAQVGGNVFFSSATLVNELGPIIYAHHFHSGSNFYFRRNSFSLSGGKLASIDLECSHIAGSLLISKSKLTSLCGPVINAKHAQIDSNLSIHNSASIKADSSDGALTLNGLKVGGDIRVKKSKIRNLQGPAIEADGILIKMNLTFLKKAKIQGNGTKGAVRLINGQIKNDLDFENVMIENQSGPAVEGSGLKVGANIYMGGRFSAIGNSDEAAINLIGCNVSKQAIFENSQIINTAGISLGLDGINVTSDVHLLQLSLLAGGDFTALRLPGVTVGGQLIIELSELKNSSDIAIDATGTSIGQDLIIAGGANMNSSPRLGAIVLNSVSVGGRVELNTSLTENWNVDGLTFKDIELSQPCNDKDDIEVWLHLLDNHYSGHAAQPYQHFAHYSLSNGNLSDYRRILIEQEKRRVKSLPNGFMKPFATVWCAIKVWMVGLGYKPWRITYWLIGLIVISMLFSRYATFNDLLVNSSDIAKNNSGSVSNIPQVCDSGSWFIFGLQVSLPLVSFLTSQACVPSDAWSWVSTITWILQFMSWFMLSIFLAGIAGLFKNR